MKLQKFKIQIFLALIFSVGFQMLTPMLAPAQTVTPIIMEQIRGELQKRGLTEMEVRARLLQKGIDLDNIPPAELPKYQERITVILDELQAGKAQGKSTGDSQQNQKNYTGSFGNTNSIINHTDSLVQPVTTIQESEVEAGQRVIQAAAKNEGASKIYGHSLFIDQSLKVFRTSDGAQAPDTYVLGDGDEVRITIFGASQTDIQQKINTEGYIQPSGVAKIFLKGLTLLQAREVIRQRLSLAYTFRSDQFAVTIATARTILVNVFGEAKITGGFNISALNSALNALSAAGGPTEIGSVRNIQLIRGNDRKNIDLYSFMNDPAAQFRFDLQNNDIVFVPVVRLVVSVEGAVNRPMAYEMLPNETLTDLILFAGDVKKDVFPDFVQIQRYINGEQRLVEYNLEDVRSGKTKVPVQNGDIVRIKSIGKPMDQYVNIEGSVYYPGKYDLSSNPTLSRLLVNAKPTYQAKTDVLFIQRIRPDETVEVITVPFPGQNGGKEFALQPRDSVKILDQASYRDIDTITVAGHVRTPFKKAFSMNDRITVKQAIDLAGGLKNSVYPVAYIFRRNLLNPVEIKYIRIELSQAEKIDLQAGDQLNIYDNVTFTNAGEVRIFGAVKNPRGFTFDSSLALRDVLTNAGGFTPGAALNRVEIFRTILSPTERTKIEMITIRVDSAYQVISPSNFTLRPYDQVVVRLTPEFTLGRTVEITGQVEYPGTYILESKQVVLSEIIKNAGGLLSDADPYGSSLFRTYRNRGNISINVEKSMLHSGNHQSDPILFEGDVININRLENTITILENGTRMEQYSINPDSTGSKNVVFQGHRSAAWYVRNFAGGFQKRVDRNSVTVTLPNDQMISTKRSLFFFRNYPNAKSGSVISMHMKPPKEKNTGDKNNWEGIANKSTASLTAILTLYLLINQLAK